MVMSLGETACWKNGGSLLSVALLSLVVNLNDSPSSNSMR